MSAPSGTPVRGGTCQGIVLCPKCQPTEQDVYDIRAMDGLRRTASGRDLACLCKSQLTPGATRTAPASDATGLMRAASQTSVGTAVKERSGAGASDLGDVEMLGCDGSDSGAVDVGIRSGMATETRERKKTSPAERPAERRCWRIVEGCLRIEKVGGERQKKRREEEAD